MIWIVYRHNYTIFATKDKTITLVSPSVVIRDARLASRCARAAAYGTVVTGARICKHQRRRRVASAANQMQIVDFENLRLPARLRRFRTSIPLGPKRFSDLEP